jgi:AbiV family abortive infection protein
MVREAAISRARRVRQLCLKHASDLVEAAERVLAGRGYPNIAFHLGLLALEEVGKAELVLSEALVGDLSNSDTAPKKLDDHVWKLNWAIWSYAMGGGKLEAAELERSRELARSLHEERIAALYVDHTAEPANSMPPRRRISRKRATAVIALAKARIEIENLRKLRRNTRPNTQLTWFIGLLSDEGSKRRIFSPEFISKLNDLNGDAGAWLTWAQQRFREIAEEEEAYTQRELARNPKNPRERPKWRIKVRLFTRYLTVRAKVLNYWNDRVPFAQLRYSKPQELLLEIELSERILVQNVWNTTLSAIQKLFVMLNIGTRELVWYELPRAVSRFYESLEDLDAPKGMGIDLARSDVPGREHQRALNEGDLRVALHCFLVFSRLPNAEAEPIFKPYLGGLMFLAKSDVFFQIEHQAREEFITAVRAACAHYDGWDPRGQVSLRAALDASLTSVGDQMSRSELLQVIDSNWRSGEGMFVDAVRAKLLADLYLGHLAEREWRKLREQEAGREGGV